MSSQIERPQRRGGRTRGAEGYHKEDILALLQCVKQVVPTNAQEWDDVLTQYRQIHAVPNTRAARDSSSLKSKFKQLLRSFLAGKDSRPEVQEAGAVLALMDAKISDGTKLQRRGGRPKGAEGFTPADVQAILRSVRQVVPVYKDDWEMVAQHYSEEYAVPSGRLSRDATSLKSKFQSLLKDAATMTRAEMAEILTLRAEIDVRIRHIGKNAALVEVNADVESNVGDVDAPNDEEIIATETVDGQEKTATSSEDAEMAVVKLSEPRHRGRTVGSEGYTRSDIMALLSCIKEVLPTGPTSWELALEMYRQHHATPNNRSQRNSTAIRIKFRQLLNWKEDKTKMLPEEVVEARAIEKEIELSTGLGKRSVSEKESNASLPHISEGRTSDAREVPHFRSHIETQKGENMEQRGVGVDKTEWAVIPQINDAEPAIKRLKLSTQMSTSVDSDALRSEIASRELELLGQREEREAEQAVWEKERAMREKQRMDMEAWTFVCDRLRGLYRERATEKNSEILGEIEEEVAVLKKKKQLLGNLM